MEDEEMGAYEAAAQAQENNERRRYEESNHWQAMLKADEAAYLQWLSGRELTRAA